MLKALIFVYKSHKNHAIVFNLSSFWKYAYIHVDLCKFHLTKNFEPLKSEIT